MVEMKEHSSRSFEQDPGEMYVRHSRLSVCEYCIVEYRRSFEQLMDLESDVDMDGPTSGRLVEQYRNTHDRQSQRIK